MTQDSVLYDPVNGANLYNRFNAIVVSNVNFGIEWALDNKPFSEMGDTYFGGNRAGFADLTGGFTGTINAQGIYDAAVGVLRTFSSVRKLRARLNVTVTGSSPWNTGSRGGPGGIIYDDTQVAFMSSAYQQTITAIGRSDMQANYVITRAGIEGGYVGLTLADGSQNPSSFRGLGLTGFFQDCKSRMDSLRNNTTTVTITVCHASCHSSCHGSRSRR
jgi:hypothetical protein